ncbi:hypothetical protein AAMO2058_001634300 [Amorphochlora amoebiformis]|uniref:Uncharacterized protein n=1 Tax=Amorphochlora amoebiformis TaxID=1561963 RepID=A0A7S0D1Q3_9EUKA|mmetsp:Transcript_17567/g.27967  ORF Transcript_17567/g.27967 Transcript_17567/m.27967 type:complete len:362 (+) Transcript_17567:89-1174(+)
MGNILKKKSKNDRFEEKISRKIDETQKKEAYENSRVIKLLLLGAGESGKSTLFKQMKRLYGVGFGKQELLIYKPGIHRNILTSCKELYLQSNELDDKRFPRPKLSADGKTSGEVIIKIPDGTQLDEQMAKHLVTLWKDPAIQKTYYYSSAFQLIDSIGYFMDNINRICEEKYVPDYQDCLRCRIRTTGVVEFKFGVEANEFIIIDVGGQRSERKKWLHCFQDVTAVIFVAAMSEYDQVLFEDSKTNRLKEAIGLFHQIVNHESFKDKTSMILFLNKSDLLKEKIKRVPLTEFFKEYEGDNTYEAALDLFKDYFAAQVENPYTQKLYIHVTCATDTDQIATVFAAVKDILLQQSLFTSGLIE